MHHYPHHIGDFDRATRHLTRIERSIYRDLLDVYYDTEHMLTLDQAALCRKVIARTPEEVEAVRAVLAEFFHETPNGWWSDRCEFELDSYRKSTTQKSAAGKASAASRAAKREQAINGNSTAVPTLVELPFNGTPTNQEPITNNHKPRKEQASATPLPSWVPEESWKAYLAMRKAIKKPLTVDGFPLAIKKLENLRAAGHAPQLVLEQSVMNSWQGLFEVKPGTVTAPLEKPKWD